MNRPPIPHSRERLIVIAGYVADILLLYYWLRTGNKAIMGAIGFMILGQVLIYNYMDAHNKRCRCTQSTRARIVDTVKKIDGVFFRRWAKFPVVEFEVDGQTYRAEGNAGNNQYTVGDELEIFFNPKKPTEIGQSFPKDNYNFCIAGYVTFGCGVLWAMICILATQI